MVISPERRLERARDWLRRAVFAHVAFVLLVALLAVVGALQSAPEVLAVLRQMLLSRYSGADDAAALVLILLGLANVSLLLLLTAGLDAHEAWTGPSAVALVLANTGLLLVLGYAPALATIALGAVGLWELSAGWRLLRANPVMVRELRGRMRGARAFVVLTLYLALMGGFALLLYFVFGAVNAQSASSATGVIGRTLFSGVVGIQLLLIIFIAPAFTAGAITGEHERQTYDLVRTTLLSTPSFIMGKVESSLAYILLLLLAAIPLQALAFLFGGIGQAELLLAFVILAVTAVGFGTVGIYYSSRQVRTLSASVRTYAAIGTLAFIVPGVLLFILNVFLESRFFVGGTLPGAPVLETFLRYLRLFAISLNPFAAAADTQSLLNEQQAWFLYPQTLVSDGSTIPMVSPWVLYSINYVFAAAVFILLTIRSTKAGDKRA